MWGFPKECPYSTEDCSIGLIGRERGTQGIHRVVRGLQGCLFEIVC